MVEWSFGDSSNLARKLLTANELIFVKYTRVGSVKFSPVIRGDTRLIEVG